MRRAAVAGELDVGAGELEGLDGRVDVAAAVVEDDDASDAPLTGRPWSTGCPRRAGRGSWPGGSARAKALNSASAMWCGSRPPSTRDVHGEAGVEGDRLEDVAHHRAGEVAADEVELEAGGLAGVHEVRAAGDVDDGLHERLVERARGRRRSGRCPRLSPSACADGLAEHDADVFDRVVHVDVRCRRVAVTVEVGERVLREGREQVVEERHRRVDRRGTGAVEVEGQLDARLAGRARETRAVRGLR